MIVVWRVTSRCNLSCPFCSYDRTLGGARREAELAEVLTFAAVLAEHQRETGDRVLVSWIGGEPLLWRHFRPATVALTGELGLRVSATTNGTTLGADDVQDFVSEHLAELTISLDAAGSQHDALRGWPGGFAQLSRTVPKLARRKRERGTGPLLRINTVLMRENLAGFEDLCRCVADWGVNEISFNQLGGRDRPEFFPEHRLMPADVEGLAERLPSLRTSLAERGVTLKGGSGYVARMRASAAGLALPVAECRPGEQFVFVDEAGRAAPCNYTASEIGVPLGEMTDAGTWRSLPARLREARARCRPAACEDCHSTQVWEKFAR